MVKIKRNEEKKRREKKRNGPLRHIFAGKGWKYFFTLF